MTFVQCRLLVVVGLANGLEWGRYRVPSRLGLTELVSRLEHAGTSVSAAAPGGLADQINALIQSASEIISRTESLVLAQQSELNVTNNLVSQTISQVEANENNRIAAIKEYNKNVLTLNAILTDMTTGSQQINDVISLANRVKKNLANDIVSINEAIGVTNDWMVKMDSWIAFVKDETEQVDQAQASLVSWGDSTGVNVNLHEVAAVKLAREVYDIETSISAATNFLLGTGNMLGYTPQSLTVVEAAGGLGWSLSPWS